MKRRIRTVVVAIVVGAASPGLAANAWASIAPTVTLDQSAGMTAGSVANLGVDLKFAPAGSDSPDHLALNLPPGLLADASINGGACLQTADLTDSACQVGSGTVSVNALGTIPISTAVTFDLVPPPEAGDLAGLAVNSSGTQIGSTGDVRVRPTGDPLGVGVTINFVLPNTLSGVPISITEINSTFNGLRYPTTCPSPPQNFGVAVDSYSDPTVHTAGAPLPVTGCSALAFSPVLSVGAVHDQTDDQVVVTTKITQGATEAPPGALKLVLPYAPLAPNVAALGLLCANVPIGTCTAVGSVSASSPLYPAPLTGQAYLTGTVSGLSLTLAFPSPFPLTLSGSVDLLTNSTTFTGLPDIPLTSLLVSLNGGPRGLFVATCAPASGTATATLTDQNGDRTVISASTFAISGCPATGGSGASGTGTPPVVTAPNVSGLGSGHPSLSFTVRAGKHAPKLRAITIVLPGGLSFVARGAAAVRGITLTGAKIATLSVSHRKLIVTLRKPVSRLSVEISGGLLHESPALQVRAKHVHTLTLTVITEDTSGRRTTIHVHFKNAGL